MKKVWRAVKNEWNEYNDGEILVRELTSNDNHPPNPEYLQRLNELSKDSYSSPSIYVMLNKRLHDLSYLMHVEKSLIIVEYLLKNSDTRFIRFIKMQTDYIKRLRSLKYMVAISEFEKVDKAQIVRRRANRIYALLTDDEELEKQRSKAQGTQYVPKTKSVNSDSNKGKKENTSNDNKKQTQKPQKQSQQQQKTNPDKNQDQDQKKKEPSSDNNQKNQNQSQNQKQVDLFDDFIDMQDTTTNQQTSTDNQDDLMPDDWLKEFANMPNSGTGQDGTALFSFENNDDFGLDDDPFSNDDNNVIVNNNNNNDNSDQKQDSQKEDKEDWLTQLTNLDNILQQPSQEKKGKSQGKTLAQMAQESNTQSIESLFTAPSTQSNNSFNPYTAFITNQPIAPNYVQQPTNNVFLIQQPLNQKPLNQQSYVSNNINNSPFDMLSTSQPIPATYSKNQNNDPFADLGKLK